VSDVLQQLRVLNARSKAREPSGSSSATGSEVAPPGVGGGKDSPKSHNGGEGHPPTEGPEKPPSSTAAVHRRHASISSSGDLEDGRKDAEGERAGGAPPPRGSAGDFEPPAAARGDVVVGGGGDFVSPFFLYGDVLGGRTSQASAENPLSLWDSPEDLRPGGAGHATSDQMTASQLRAMAAGAAMEAGGVARGRGAPLFVADPWGDGGSARSLGGEVGGGGGGGGRGVQQLLPGEGALSSAANGVVRELTWENSSLQKRVEVQANALIEMSVEKERWLAEKMRVVSREKEASARAQLLLEEKTQLKESLQAVIEGLLEENTTLRSAAGQTASAPAHAPAPAQPPTAKPPPQQAAAKPPMPPLALPARPPDHTQSGTGEDGSGSTRSSAKAHAATPRESVHRASGATPRGTTPRPQLPAAPPAPPPQVTPFMGVAMGPATLVGTGAGGGLHVAPDLPRDGADGDGRSSAPKSLESGGASLGASVPESSRGSADAQRASEDLRLEWSLLLSPRYVCLCVCECVCECGRWSVYVYLCICISVYAYLYLYICISVYAYLYTYIDTYIDMHIYVYMYLCIRISIYVYLYVYLYAYICIRVCVCVCVCVCACVCVCVCARARARASAGAGLSACVLSTWVSAGASKRGVRV